MSNDEFNFNEEKSLTDVKLAEINGMVKRLFDFKNEIADMEDKVSEKKAEMDTLKNTVLMILEAQNMTKLPTEHGMVYSTTKFQVSMPKDPGRAAQLRAYFASRGMEDMLTVNHQSLNSFYNSVVEEKKALGEEIDMKDIIPGVDEPTARVTLAMKKA